MLDIGFEESIADICKKIINDNEKLFSATIE